MSKKINKLSSLSTKWSSYGKKHPKAVKSLPIVAIAIFGIATLLVSQAATFSIALEAETGTRSGSVNPISDSTASGGSAIQFGTGGGTGGTEPAGVFITKSDLARAKSRNGAAAPFGTGYSNQTSRANSALNQSPNPFYMEQADYLANIEYGWCGEDTDNKDDSLNDATNKLERDGALTQTLGLQYALTGDTRYGDKALTFLKAWANRSTPVNMYDFHTDPVTFNSSLRGETEAYCSFRPWNFALDGLFQGYGLLGFSDAYVLLKNNGYSISQTDQDLITAYIRRLTEAVNSSFHTWTRWADNHKNSSAYTRYRADNHLAWSLAPMLAASVAMNDNALKEYCLNNGTWYDSRAGNYNNPSSIKNVLDLSILSDGRIIDPVEFDREEVYTYFHLQAMNLTVRIAEASYGEDLWNYKGADGAGLEKAYTSASTQVISGSFSGDSWQFEVPYNKWPTVAVIKSARDKGRTSYVQPGYGPVTLLVGQ